MSLEKRIVDLEVRAAYQDKLIAELDGVLREFSTRVETLESLLKDVKESANAEPIGPADEKPPHY
ncbi:MAG: SlyX family protein [Acidobacteriota bacterium]|nr:SlyX family protein [Acidobacteriota bacterium]MDH3786341.1 SlyX family protein [Acidobacteriota bacterium]